MNTEMALDGFSEISLHEQQEINGGIAPFIIGFLAGIAVAASSEILRDWDNFKNGLRGLPEEKNES